VPRGKPAPYLYLKTAERVGVDHRLCEAVEDSSNGLRSAAAASMAVIAVPNPHYPPDPDALALAVATVPAIADLTPELVEQVSS
jgi:beta-phosphoglucomutase-like phosphatase (HAD superfamily)